MPLWIPITIAAAFFQNLRSALQKHLKGQLSDVGATTTRFFYAWPLAILYSSPRISVPDFLHLFTDMVVFVQELCGWQYVFQN